MSVYPTRARIEALPAPTYKPETLRALRAWKREFVGARRSERAILALIERLAVIYDKPVSVEFVRGGACVIDAYSPHARRIRLNAERLSVITALHEFAHHLYGSSELKACRWSVWLFKRTFPRTFARMTWRGHMLVRNEATQFANERARASMADALGLGNLHARRRVRARLDGRAVSFDALPGDDEKGGAR